MDYQENFINPLLSIPQRKIDNEIRKIIDSFPGYEGRDPASGLPDDCLILIDAIHRYANANIPVDYWSLDMDYDFKGDKVLLKKYNDIVEDLYKTYDDGIKLCLAGKHGVGKSFTASCVLKRAVEKGFSGFYTTLDSVVSLMAAPSSDGKYETKQFLMMVDFLVIDEFDPRFMGSSNSSDLYGRILEPTLRHRIQNKLPLLLCTNSAKVTDSFSGALNDSISSLMNLVRTIPVLGADYRPVKAGKK